ncbi:MAG: hypothetical protein NTV70_17700 [Acidobacteria bacterium]|nr:hypothetical protein [Acidobacteriota bacterium]
MTASPDDVRQQLALLATSEVFRTSKRCRAFLEFVVERSLAGRAAELREKVIGVEVFQRHPGYDSNEDPVVRATAGDVRKRLAQYYQEASRASELRIEMQPGSYVPEFRMPLAVPQIQPEAVTLPEEPLAEPGTAQLIPPTVQPATGVISRRKFWAISGASVAATAAVAMGWRWARPRLSAGTPFEKFWAPLLSAPGSALICIGQSKLYNFPLAITPEIEKLLDPRSAREAAGSSGPKGSVALRDVQPVWDRYVPLGDAETLSRIAILFDRRGKAYRVRGSAHTSLADLREGSAVLVGAFSNDWTLRISQGLRFHLARTKEDQRYVEDAEHPDFRGWMGATGNAFQGNSLGYDFLDYAIISRVFESTTGTPVVSLGGITHLGTAEAGEFLTSPALLNEALKAIDPATDWERRNVQLVIETKVIGTSATPPRLLATHVW